MRAPARAVAYATDAPTIPRPTMARSCCVVTPWTVSDGADPVPLDSPTRGHIVAAMSRHAVVTHPAVRSRSEAVPHRRLERHRIRSGSGTLPGDVRKPSEFGPAPAANDYEHKHPRARVLAAGCGEPLQKPIHPELLCRLVASVTGR